MSYIPVAQSQYQPSTGQSKYHCVEATCAEAVDRVTVGAVHTDHEAIAKAGGIVGRGMNYPEAVAATYKVTGVKGEVRYGMTPLALKAALTGGHSVTVSIHTSVTHGTSCGTYNFIGGHSLFLNSYVPDTFHLDDVGTTPVGFHDCPASLIVKAALLRSGERGINAIVWPKTEGVSWKAVRDRAIRSEPSYTKGTDLGRTKAGHVYPGGRTQNGDAYKLPDGRITNGWVHIQANGRWGWTIGECFR